MNLIIIAVCNVDDKDIEYLLFSQIRFKYVRTFYMIIYSNLRN